MKHEKNPAGGRDPDPNVGNESPGEAHEWVELTAIYVGGPNDGETEEISAGPDPGDAPGVVRVVGFELWPVARPMRPTGRYEPDTSANGFTVPFIWQAYTPEEQTRRQHEEEASGRLVNYTGLTRIISRLFWGTWIFDWYMRAAAARTSGPSAKPPHGQTRRVRIWAPFAIGFLGGSLAVLLEKPIGEFLGVYDPLLGYAVATEYAGAVIALVAALASGTWRGLLTLILGFATVGLPYGGLPAAIYLGFILGLLGVPTYAAVVTLVAVARAPRLPAGPVAGWPTSRSDSIPHDSPEAGPPPP